MSLGATNVLGASAAFNWAADAADEASLDQDLGSAFDSIDRGATGVITQTEFEQAFASLDLPSGIAAQGADAIFAQLDPNGTGRVLRDDFISGMDQLLTAASSDTNASNSANTTDPASAGLTGLGSLFSQVFAVPAADPAAATDPSATSAVSQTSSSASQASLTQML